jgi:hypothetical protein
MGRASMGLANPDYDNNVQAYKVIQNAGRLKVFRFVKLFMASCTPSL